MRVHSMNYNARQPGMTPPRCVSQGAHWRKAVIAMVGAVLMAILLIAPRMATAQERYVGRSLDVRTLVYFKVSEGALQKLVPQGWEVDPIRTGAAVHANLCAVFVDQMAALDASEKPTGIVRNVLFQIPVRPAAGGARAM